MPSWGNTDAPNLKPKWDVERQLREVVQLATANTTNSGNTVITLAYNDGYQNQVANLGIAAGQSVFVLYNGVGGNNSGANGFPSMFLSNTTVSSTSGNNVVLASGVFNTVATGTIIEFDKSIAYPSAKAVAKTYNPDTVLVTQTRSSAANNQIGGNIVPGWVHVQKKVNNDGTVRYIRETLVTLANPSASNVYSGNTSWGVAFANT